MATCPNGHPSGAEDWCEVCGIRMPGAVPPPAAQVPPPGPGGYGYPGPPAGEPTQAAEPCPSCGTPREGHAQFCEECRYNFVTQSAQPYVPPAMASGFSQGFHPQHPQGLTYQPSGPSHVHRGPEPLGPDTGAGHAPPPPPPPPPPGPGLGVPPQAPPQPDPRMGGDFVITPPSSAQPPPQHGQHGQHGQQFPGQGPPPQPVGWVAVVAPDREYFAAMMSRSGPEAQGLNLPAYSPEQKVPLVGPQIAIGRKRQSTGEVPDIDLARPPEDPGVSHKHAVLVEQPEGGWAVVDQNSTNGTTVNGAADPIQPFVPVPLREGDRVHVGAWTTIRIERG
ncbi:FHA domain-containing protein [Streptomyces sp. B8F3]|uniref:FHA domain-containing protein n=1 Tax=Streptomyces sp. B8F3 TaxID=3153573 RepID=UPI00325D9A9E